MKSATDSGFKLAAYLAGFSLFFFFQCFYKLPRLSDQNLTGTSVNFLLFLTCLLAARHAIFGLRAVCEKSIETFRQSMPGAGKS